MTVLDSSAVIDLLLGESAFAEVEALLVAEGSADAPDLLVFEVLAALRRLVQRDEITPERAGAAVDDLADVAVDLHSTLTLRRRAWELRDNLTAADALFVALAEELGQPLATKDRSLAAAAREHAGIDVLELASA